MKRILILVGISFLLCSTASAFQDGGGKSTKKGSSKKKEAATKKNSGTKSANTTPPTPSAPPAPTVQVFGPGLSIDLGNNVKLELVQIKAGSFQMGSEKSDFETPLHRVTISKPFYMGKYEVTQVQWQAVMGNNPSYFKNCDNCPVEAVSWDAAQQFIIKLNGNDGYTYRLPSEAEWEYACRAGTTGDRAGDFDSMAWYDKNSGRATHPVGTKQPNAWGLYDMHGNVWEWCQDWYDANYYRASPATDPQGPSSGQSRVLRGGSWYHLASYARSDFRDGNPPGDHLYFFGFRVVAVARTP